MRLRALLAILAAAVAAEAAAQKWGVEQKSSPPKSQSQQQKAPFASPSRDPQRERCENFRKELRRTRIQERETTNTGARDQAALHREQIRKDMQQAGCP